MSDLSAHSGHPTQTAQPPAAGAVREIEALPFTVRIVRDEPALLKAVVLRHTARACRLPALAQDLMAPEADDLQPDCTVWIAESKVDGAALGTMRVQTNRARPLQKGHDDALPQWLREQSLADAKRLAVAPPTKFGRRSSRPISCICSGRRSTGPWWPHATL